jgi:hypothetical protein
VKDVVPPAGDPLWQRIPAPFAETFGCLGQLLKVTAARRDLLDQAQAAWGRFTVPPDDGSAIRVTLLAEGEQSERAVTAIASLPDPIPLFREHGTLFVAQDGRGSITVADLADSRVVVFVGPAGCGEETRATLLESPIWRIAAWRGLTTVHAAGIVIDGLTLVLRGPSGAGKSTLAALSALAGHGVLAEEGVWVDSTGPTPCLRGAPWRLRLDTTGLNALAVAATELALPLPPPLLARLDHSRSNAGTMDLYPEAGPLEVARDLGGLVTEMAELGALVLLTPAEDGSPTWSALAPEQAVAQYEAMTTVGERTQVPRRWEAARALLLRGGAYRLSMGDPAATFRTLLALAAHLSRGSP